MMIEDYIKSGFIVRNRDGNCKKSQFFGPVSGVEVQQPVAPVVFCVTCAAKTTIYGLLWQFAE
jgi:hypothetical protein